LNLGSVLDNVQCIVRFYRYVPPDAKCCIRFFILDISFDVGPIRHFQYRTGTANKRLAEQVGVQQSISPTTVVTKKIPVNIANVFTNCQRLAKVVLPGAVGIQNFTYSI
jgi:hypothetical protein